MKGIQMGDLHNEVVEIGKRFAISGEAFQVVKEADLNDPLVVLYLINISAMIQYSLDNFQNSLRLHVEKKLEELS
jgi:hypothetical protein